MKLSPTGTAPAVIAAALAASVVIPHASDAQTIWRRAPNGLTPAAAKAAFGKFIHKRYPAAEGYWTCPAVQNFYCKAEVRVGQKRHRIEGSAKLSGNTIVFSNVGDHAWIRRWSPYTEKVIRGFGSPGSASVNSPYFDWAFLAAQAYDSWQQHRTSFAAGAYDGDGRGWNLFYAFSCKTQGSLIRCTNALGDSIRYSPTGEPGR